MGTLRVRFSQSSERRGVFNYALKVEVVDALDIPSKIFVYHQSPAGINGNTFAEFDHVATPVDFQEIPEDAASETVPWYRTDKCIVWFRCISDMELAKQLFVDDINALRRTFDVLTSENNFARQTTVEFSGSGVHEPDSQEDKTILQEIEAMKEEIAGKVSKDAMSDVNIETNTVEGMRAAVQDVGSVLGAKVVNSAVIALSLLSMCLGSYGAGFSGERFADIDLDENPVVVTNVTFDGLATLTDITNIIDDISTNFVPVLRKDIADASVAGTNYVDSATNDVLSAAGDYTDSATNVLTTALTSGTLEVQTAKTALSYEETDPYFDEWLWDGITYGYNTAAAKVAYACKLAEDDEQWDALPGYSATEIFNNDTNILIAASNYTDAAVLSAATAATNYTDASISPTSPAFSNAVLSVGLGIDTNTVAAINELVDSSQGLPVSGMTSVGALLLALAAAIAALKRGKADKSDVDPLLFAQYYPDGSVKSAAEFTSGIKYDAPDTVNRTITVKPFCNTRTAANDNSNLVGRVVIPPFVDASGNGYISDDGTRYMVVGVSVGGSINNNTNLTAIIAPNTVRTIGVNAFNYCTTLTSVSLPAATTIGERAFRYCTLLTFVDFGDTPRSSVPSLGSMAFNGVPATCKIIVPYTQYDAWIAADGWKNLPQEFVRHAEKADKPAAFTTGNLAKFDANGNPVDSGVKPSDKLDSTSAAPAFSSDSSVSYPVDSRVTYNGKLYKCTTATTGGTWDASKWTADTMTDPDAVLDITAQNQLRVVAKDGTLLWAQGYDLASTSSATLACDAANNFTFANGATSQAFTLPTAPTGKVGDFGLDIDNSANASAATMTLTGLDSTFSVVVPEGESLNDMLAIAAGELARFYISLSTFRVNNLPTWHIVKQVVENGGATA